MMSEMRGTSWIVALRITSGFHSSFWLDTPNNTIDRSAGFGGYEDELDFYRRVQRQHVDADGRPDVTAGVAEDFEQQLGRPVGDLRLLGERRVAGDERAHPKDA